MRVLAVALLIVLAGCTSDKPAVEEEPAAPAAVDGITGNEPVSGFVFDAAVAPLIGATVSIPSLAIEATTDENGRYAFSGLPYDEPLVFVAQIDGYTPKSKSTQLIPETALHLNFTLDPVPVAKPYYEVMTFEGIIACSMVVKENANAYRTDCTPSGAPDERVWEFEVKAGAAGMVIELDWQAQSDTARDLNVTVETVDFGEFDEVIGRGEGSSLLRIQIPAEKVDRFYGGAGGMVRVKVDIGRNIADDEANSGVGFASQQSFDVFASVFYVSPPPPTYTIADAG